MHLPQRHERTDARVHGHAGTRYVQQKNADLLSRRRSIQRLQLRAEDYSQQNGQARRRTPIRTLGSHRFCRRRTHPRVATLPWQQQS